MFYTFFSMNLLILVLAQYLLFVCPALIVYAWITSQKKDRCTQWTGFALTILLTAVFGFVGAHLYAHARPFVVTGIPPLFPHTTDNGFPSNHTLVTAAIAAGLWKISKPTSIVGWIVALLVGTARVLAGVHWPIDIAGSVMFAILAGWIATLITPILQEKLLQRLVDTTKKI